MSVSIGVHLFAQARDLAGTERLTLTVPHAATVAQLRVALAQQVPALTALLARSALAVNHDFVDDTHILHGTDEVALIPPVSGG